MKNKLFALILILSFTKIFSQQDTSVVTINEIIIKDAKSVDIISEKIQIKKINIHMPRTAGEVFKDIPGVNIIKRSGFATEPIIRVFKNEQINLMIDGGTKVTHSCANRMDPMTTRVAAGEIEQIELYKGPYSVRFGQTFGGIVNILTHKTKSKKEKYINGSVEGRYELNGNGKSTLLSLNGGIKKFDFIANANYREFDNYFSGSDQEIASSFTAYDYSAKLGYNITNKQRLQLSLRQTFAEDILHAGLPMDVESDRGDIIALDYSIKKINNLIKGVNAKVYGSKVDHLMTNEFRPNAKYALAISPVLSETVGGKVEFVLNPSEKIYLYSGVDYKYATKDGQRNRTVYENFCTGMVFAEPKEFVDLIWQNSYEKDLGVFTEMRYPINNKIFLSSGVRHDIVEVNALNPADDFVALYSGQMSENNYNNTSFFANLKYKLPKNYQVQLSAGRGNRNPDLLELYINHLSIGLDAYEYVGNPNLKSEQNNQIDLAISKTEDNLMVYANVFYSYFTNYITAKVDTTIDRKFLPCKDPEYTKRFVNITTAEQYGFDAGVRYKFKEKYYINTNINYTIGNNLEWNEPLAEVSPLMSVTSVGYKFKKLQLEIKNRFAAKQERVSESFGETETESFDIVGLSTFYTPIKQLKIGFAIDNIFDTNYYEHLNRPYRNMDTMSMYFEPGRNYKISVKYNF